MDKIPKKNKMINQRIKSLRDKFEKYNIDGYIIPKNDEFFSEYAAINRLETISKFTGSAGIAIILKKKNYLNTSAALIQESIYEMIVFTEKLNQNISRSPKFLMFMGLGYS